MCKLVSHDENILEVERAIIFYYLVIAELSINIIMKLIHLDLAKFLLTVIIISD